MGSKELSDSDEYVWRSAEVGRIPDILQKQIFDFGKDAPGAASTVSSNFLHFHRQPRTPIAFRVSVGKRAKDFCFVGARSGQQLRTSASEKR